MDGNATRDMDLAWRAYLVEHKADPIKGKGWNPREAFEAGWLAANVRDSEVRSSGWASVNE